MLKGLGDIGQMLKLQKEFKNAQKRITGTKMTGSSADGGVTATVTGEYKIVGMHIDEKILKERSAKDVERLVMDAVNDGVNKIKEFSVSEMSRLTGGLDLPGLAQFMK